MTKQDDDLLISADLLLRITALENLLISKGIIDKEEYFKEMSELAAKIAKSVLSKVKDPKDVDDLLKSLLPENKNIKN